MRNSYYSFGAMEEEFLQSKPAPLPPPLPTRAPTAPPPLPRPQGSFWQRYGGDILVGTITAVTGALAVYYAMRYVGGQSPRQYVPPVR